MAAQLLKTLLKQQISILKKRKENRGFTILELLVATLIATMVIVVLLNMVVDLLQTDRREYARNETQREMQMALDYMVNDIREAAYVYDNIELNDVRTFLKLPTGFTPILAFWKPETFSDQTLNPLGNCSQFGTDAVKRPECDQLIVRRRAFSLVVYLQKQNDSNDQRDGWKGISRITRYQLNKYTQNGITNLDKTTGYVDPQENTVTFASWPRIASSDSSNPRGGSVATGAGQGLAVGADQVLVDFVDFPTTNRTDNLTPPQTPVCPGTNYSRIPTDSTFNSPSFMVCVSTNNTFNSGADSSNTNQDVLIFLRGNPTGKAGVKIAPLLAVKTQAVARGVVNKQPQ
uniref:Prepilin-type cleavage/methylation-like n=1 Tax=Phormidium sp. KS TaxID=654446 RepID=A0A3G9CL60_9CYAN|nr:prepilin-type cleavage/methylation-like [Phormidium sp. KS]